MSCCTRHVRYGLIDASGELIGSPGCDLSAELAALSDALEKANALGLYQDLLVVAGQALFTANSIAPPAVNCAFLKSNLRVVANQIEALVLKNTPADQRPGLFDQFAIWVKGLPSWALPVAAASAGGLALVSTTGGLLARRGRRGKRRSRR